MVLEFLRLESSLFADFLTAKIVRGGTEVKLEFNLEILIMNH